MAADEQWVLMTKDHKCVVKGKSRKYIMELNEPTRKELVSYPSKKSADSALRRSYIQCSPMVTQQYGSLNPWDLAPVQVENDID